MNMTVDPTPENNYFILLGDWGCSSSDTSGLKVQTAVAKLMKTFVTSQKSAGKNLLFVGALGDNFYGSGMDASCNYWKPRWSDMYEFVATDYPWLAVFGNHDWGGHDEHAICAWGTDPYYIDATTKIPYAANQIDKNKGGCNPANYFLPDFAYYYNIPELSFEYIVMEESEGDCVDSGGSTWCGQDFKDCDKSQKTGCNYLGRMKTAAQNMMNERANVSNNTNFMIVNHYAGHGAGLRTNFIKARGSQKYVAWTAGGHSHAQECMAEDSNGVCIQIKSGGGGHGGGTQLHGFYVIGFDENKKMIQPFKFNDPRISCTPPCGESVTEEDILQSNFYNCCFDQQDGEGTLCQFYDLDKCDLLIE
jgi:hypothetical protein